MNLSETYLRRKSNPLNEDNEKKKRKDSIRKVSSILKKCESLRSVEEKKVLESFSDVTKQIKKRKERIQIYKERIIEKEDSTEIIKKKSEKLAEIISKAKHLVCYTGAGISTSAKIPDYRGSNGIWTMLQQGKEIEKHDLSLADPTFTHMALYELQRRNILRYVVSQNCDGLHLRAGLSRNYLSEVHGNMYIEVCKHCKPNVEYWRLFDTTELTSRFYHKTNRRCHLCNKPLIDSIVHFGERGSLKWPLNWEGACKHSEKADVILCLGSSLKVLKKYAWLWQMDRPKNKRAKICIINLQWTSKDNMATMKINGKCDDVMMLIMKHLNIKTPTYSRLRDPIFFHASDLCYEELHTVSQPMLKITNYNIIEKNICNVRPNKSPHIRTPKNQNSHIKTNLSNRQNMELNSVSDIFENSSILNEKFEIKTENIDMEKIKKEEILIHQNETKIKNTICCKYENDSEIKIEAECKEIALDDKQNNCSQLINPCDIYLGYMHSKNFAKTHQSVIIDIQSFKSSTENETKSEIEVAMALYDLSKTYDRLPNWYEVRYAYSGLHSIIKPPPPEINLWSSYVVPIYKMNRKKAECQFCFDNYAEMNCQFYRNISSVFLVKTLRRGKVIVCECCDYTDSEDDGANDEFKSDVNDTQDYIVKKAKIEHIQPVKQIQAGWFGKGYRKTIKKKKR